MAADSILGILEKYQGRRGSLISILEDIQVRYGYLPADALKVVAKKTGRPLVDIYGVATFYRAFSLKPRGKHLASVCLGTACHVRGAPMTAQEFERQLGIRAGQTTPGREFTLETVNCVGACALGPVAVVDGHYFRNVTTSRVKPILDQVREGLDRVEVKDDKRVFPVDVACGRCNHSLMDPGHPIDGYPAIWVTASFGEVHGWLRLSCLYGSFAIESQYDIPRDVVAHFFCPHCHAELLGASRCLECGAPMIPMIVRRGGIVQICARRGCKAHQLDIGA